ncbi:MAG: lysylphosphatidylglycerol synthase transmembrane domain-containing protein [Syntrophales bacterium]|nr:lysylphosphatidylglycerol synthase transmembrane domain-containing protein [Syntrophales bacterium]
MKNRRIWLIVATGAFVVLIAVYINSQRHLLEYLKNVNLSTVAYLMVIMILFQITNGLILKEIASKFNIRLISKEWFGLPFVTAMGNYITPFSGGMIARASYLKYRHSFPYARFVSVLGASYLIYFWVAGIAGIITLMLPFERSMLYWELILFFAGVVLVISSLAMLPTIKIPGNNWVAVSLNNAIDGWTLIKRDSLLLVKLALYTLANILLTGLTFWLAFVALSDSSLSFGTIFLISLFSSFSILLKITPGNLGISEAIITLSSGILGVGAGLGLLASLLIRAVSLIPIFALGPIFSFVLTRELTAHRSNNKSKTV